MELSTNYLTLLICISLIVIGATLIYMYFTKKSDEKIPKKKQIINGNNKNIEYRHQEQEEEQEEEPEEFEDQNNANTAEAYTSGTFRIKPKHIINDEDEENNEEAVIENFNAPKTSDGNIRQSMGDSDVLHSRNSNPLSFIDKLQKRFDSSS